MTYFLRQAARNFRNLPEDERWLAAKLLLIAGAVTFVIVSCYYKTLPQQASNDPHAYQTTDNAEMTSLVKRVSRHP